MLLSKVFYLAQLDYELLLEFHTPSLAAHSYTLRALPTLLVSTKVCFILLSVEKISACCCAWTQYTWAVPLFWSYPTPALYWHPAPPRLGPSWLQQPAGDAIRHEKYTVSEVSEWRYCLKLLQYLILNPDPPFNPPRGKGGLVNIQWNPFITDTFGDQQFVCYGEVSPTQGLTVYFW